VKRTVTGLSCIVTLLLSAVTGNLMINLVAAIPIGLYLEFPTEPITTPPQIDVYSPVQNQNYDSNNIWLNFTIIKPDTWFKLPEKYGGSDEKGNPLYVIFGNITSVYYEIDGGEPQNIPVHDLSYVAEAFPKRTLNFSTNLTLPKGIHSIKVCLKADSYYLITEVYTPENATDTRPSGTVIPSALSTVVLNGSSEIIRFAIEEPEPFPVVPVAAASGASVAVVGVGLLVYFKKRKHQNGK